MTKPDPKPPAPVAPAKKGEIDLSALNIDGPEAVQAIPTLPPNSEAQKTINQEASFPNITGDDSDDTAPGVPDDEAQSEVDSTPAQAPNEVAPLPAATPAAPPPAPVSTQSVSNQPASIVNPNLAQFVIRKASEKSRYLKMMIYGDYGTGKTFLAGTAADVKEMSDVLLISIEAGDMSLSTRTNIDIVDIKSYKQLARVFEFLKIHLQLRDSGDDAKLAKLQKRFTGMAEDTPLPRSELRKYRTVVLDSLSEAQKYVMYQLLGIDPLTSKLDEEPTPAQFKEWGQGGEMIRLLVRGLRDLPINVILVSSQKTKEDDLKRIHISPNLPGGLANDVQGFMDIVGLYRMVSATPEGENTPRMVRRLFISPIGRFQAKSRLQGLNGITHLDDPTIATIYKGV